MTILAWHNDITLKNKFISRLEEHARLDELVQGIGFEKNGQVKGCNIGCLFDKYDHVAGEKESGIPESILRLADAIFEGLLVEASKKFAVEWPKAIKPGANLSRFKGQFCAFLMRENIERVLILKINEKLKEEIVKAIRMVLALHEDAAASAARSAAVIAAWSAAWSAESAAYELDHLIPLELGGANHIRNLWPQPWPQARMKDVVETCLKRHVCSGSLSLKKAQNIIRLNWYSQYQDCKKNGYKNHNKKRRI